MAVAAFKSTSRRPTTSTSASSSFRTSASDVETKLPHSSSSKKPNSPNKAPPSRRSRSVSAVSRSYLETTSTSSSSDFVVKRDNPLYWGTASPPDNENDDKTIPKTASFEEPTSQIQPNKPKSLSLDDNRRGRSVSRAADAVKNVSGNGRGIGRSLSRVDTSRRGRSVSRVPVARGRSVNSESDIEQEGSVLTKYRNRNGSSAVSNVGEKSNVVSSSIDALDRTTTHNSTANLPSLSNLNWKDEAFGSSFSEAEERTIKAVYEQMKSFQGDNLVGDASSHIYETVRSEVRRAIADIRNDLENAIRRSNATAIAATSITDIHPDLVNPSAVELVLDIRREYADKLAQSQERARKLRADLAVEEHRVLELSRILKEVLPDPKTSNAQKSRPGRKSSIERRKVSKRLTEEAMAYFDECVSLSTFDSSDFSSLEDPPINLIGASTPVGGRLSFPQASPAIAANHCPSSCCDDKQKSGSICSHDASGSSATGTSKEPTRDEVSPSRLETHRKFQFSFSHRPNATLEAQQDIRNYVKSFEKDAEKVNTDLQRLRSSHKDLDAYDLHSSPQCPVFDRVLCKNRIESGSLLLCGGGGGGGGGTLISLSPFVI